MFFSPWLILCLRSPAMFLKTDPQWHSNIFPSVWAVIMCLQNWIWELKVRTTLWSLLSHFNRRKSQIAVFAFCGLFMLLHVIWQSSCSEVFVADFTRLHFMPCDMSIENSHKLLTNGTLALVYNMFLHMLHHIRLSICCKLAMVTKVVNSSIAMKSLRMILKLCSSDKTGIALLAWERRISINMKVPQMRFKGVSFLHKFSTEITNERVHRNGFWPFSGDRRYKVSVHFQMLFIPMSF